MFNPVTGKQMDIAPLLIELAKLSDDYFDIARDLDKAIYWINKNMVFNEDPSSIEKTEYMDIIHSLYGLRNALFKLA